MAKTSLRVKAARKPKFAVRAYNRCPICGRSHAYIRKFNMCRICFRNAALRGDLPGVIKASW
ncbi:MAG TPA: type Z 30S ribosomal protein S14 [Myxococcota bacterium]|mgnify:FL=1|nr:type Z 30S ribosomal protein S14 [Myxococcota bacterium]HNZ02622.1 type Z 30S ribosomal protein S14 [Myxococcota bacterium]HOD08171.1 type Z 30S ribosomal protein S14 [Myxococcota bacterium]HPB50310.1 type Z 30S ribosomal protein S14 [Myxococcota bacterium]HQP95862.1 type Z 30S ribosomal protein S14 [Myxococcota bacterium]